MTETRIRRRPVWKILGLVGGAAFIVVGAFCFWINAVAASRWARMEKDLQALHAEIQAREPVRPLLRDGEAAPGRAWDDYAQALTAALPDQVLGEFVARGPKADRAKVVEVVAAQGAILDHLRRGAGKADGRFPVRWEDGANAKTPPLVQCQRLANLAVCRARLLSEEGKPREAAELLLDACQFGRDIGHGSLINEMIALANLSISLDELRAVVSTGAFSREELTGIAAALERLDQQFPRNGQAILSEAAILGFTFLKTPPSFSSVADYSTGSAGDILTTWRYGFSARLVQADAFAELVKQARKFEKSDGLSWTEAQAALKAMESEGRASSNPIVKGMMTSTATERICRQRRAQLRLVRGAVHYRLTGEPPALEDPFGANLLWSRSGNSLKLWSVGDNGADDGGAGEWDPKKGKDIVIEVPR